MALSNQRWALTGAAGHIGSVLRDGLRGEVAELRCFDQHPIPVLAADERAYQLDLADFDAMTEAFDGLDGVLHLGGIADEADFRRIAQVNIVGTMNVFEAARRAGLSRIVFASSNHVTGMYPVDVPVDPAIAVRPDGFYAVSKVAGEALGQVYAEKFGFGVVCLRIGTVATRPTERRHLSTWVSYADTVRSFRAAMTRPVPGFATFYVSSANRDAFWDVEGGAPFGFRPEDRADDFADGLDGTEYRTQGGKHATTEYTLGWQDR
jgi:uronate dehydrogenase